MTTFSPVMLLTDEELAAATSIVRKTAIPHKRLLAYIQSRPLLLERLRSKELLPAYFAYALEYVLNK